MRIYILLRAKAIILELKIEESGLITERTFVARQLRTGNSQEGTYKFTDF
ncbi:hypothetical protein H6G90_03675 [Nostoc sp. FACHB-145]|nr:hypothetical protein [Nostoc sp. FACHB-152]MBD2466759.1 hypothetical protein [Nostoc sp. FACHB-145]